MKQCPQCKRTYADETLNFCLEDGSRLTDDNFNSEPSTAENSPNEPAGEADDTSTQIFKA